MGPMFHPRIRDFLQDFHHLRRKVPLLGDSQSRRLTARYAVVGASTATTVEICHRSFPEKT